MRAPLFDLSFDVKNNHGRRDKRSAGLLSAHSAIKVLRDWIENSSPEDEHQHTRSFISSVSPVQAERLGRAVREHWSVDYQDRKQLAIALILKARPFP